MSRYEDLSKYSDEVKDHDITNREGHAAKVYFNDLFGKGFSRDDKENEINKKLNYGYAILRSYFCRSIIQVGLDPRIGLFHKSIFNYWSLASDLMEPFRPFVDYFVFSN
jgi:CRISPR-associated protein Cas1